MFRRIVAFWYLIRRKRTPTRLLVMRAEDMFVVHPHTDWSHICDFCHQPVGIYPSGMKVLRTYKNVEIICNHCTSLDGTFIPAPGSIEEGGVSVPNPEFKKH